MYNWPIDNNFLQYQPYYIVVKKGDVYLAVAHYNGQGVWFNPTYALLNNQGFILQWQGYATSEENAISQAKECCHQAQLQSEIDRLKDELNKIKVGGGASNQNPLIVLGFKETDKPSPEELKARKNKLSKACHPDIGGSEFLMKLINAAYEKLKI
ncbi:J domain-containing protein [Proteus terrae]|uniref:J domain-containing protein n=1 Tax=Proteus terrae TaxID=1574161 RepID=UPI001F1A6BD5|nr:J domain-containing protein [Proteus terrae]